MTQPSHNPLPLTPAQVDAYIIKTFRAFGESETQNKSAEWLNARHAEGYRLAAMSTAHDPQTGALIVTLIMERQSISIAPAFQNRTEAGE